MTTREHALHTFMAQVTDLMASEYQRIYAAAAEDPGTAGDEGEENWATLLREWLPPSYHVATKGRLIGTDGRMSPQVDVLVLKPFYPPKLRDKRVWLANGVAAAFECKNTLRSEHITASVERCRQFKSLFPRRTGTPEKELRSSLIYGILAHSHAWKAPGSKPVHNVTSALEGGVQLEHPSELMDLVCVSDLATWSAATTAYYRADWNPQVRDHLERLFMGPWGVTSSMVCAARAGERQEQTFQPIGAALAYVTQRLAWNDPSIRDLADYYRLTNLWGSGEGVMHFWPQSVFSDEVRSEISQGRIVNEGGWNEWNMSTI